MSALGEGTANFEPMEPEVGLGRVMKAAWDNASLGATTTSAITAGIERGGLSEIGVKQEPKKINAMFPGLNADRAITVSEAEYIMDRRKQKQENQDVIDLASDSFLKGTVAPFVSGAARSMIDPVDLSVGFITGGIGTGLAKGASVARKVAIDAAEAALAASIAEAPVAMEMNESFEEYTAKDFLQNVAMASVLQVGILHGGSSAFKGTAKALEFAGDKTADGMLRVAEVMESQGLKSDSFLNTTINKIKMKFDKITPLNNAIERNLPGVEIGDDFSTSMKNVIKSFEDGVIDEKQLKDFRAEAIANGVDPKMMEKAVDKNAPLKFDEKEAHEVQQVIKDRTNQVDYDPDIQKVDQDMDTFDPDTFAAEEFKNTQTKLETLDLEDETLRFESEDVSFTAKDLKESIDKNINEQEFFKEFAACKRGA